MRWPEAALNISDAQRDDFLQRACGSDADLRAQVGELVRSYQTSAGSMEAPAFETAARDVAVSGAKRSLAGREVGRYLILSHHGSGGIGDVWLAKDRELAREVALKLLSQELPGDSEHARRFRQEARAASCAEPPEPGNGVRHRSVRRAAIHRPGIHSGNDGAGGAAQSSMIVTAALDIATQVAAALGAAHSAGIVHRDIKPENIMIRPDGLVKVLDFGLARFLEAAAVGSLGAAHSTLTRPGIILGTARYMSPEQARGLPVDGRSDIFSLGVVLYELLAGTAPFTGGTASDVLAAILREEPAPLSRYSRDVPAQLERIVRRCLQKDSAARYASAHALKDELTQLTLRMRRPAAKPWGIAAAACAVLAALVIAYFPTGRKEPAAPPSMRCISRACPRAAKPRMRPYRPTESCLPMS
jgi:serine/threonine protein kinase